MGRPKLYHTEEERKAAAKARYERWVAKPGNAEKEYKKNQRTQAERFKRWRLKHLKEHAAKSALERAKRLQRCPPWADIEAIKEFYKNAPDGYHVDHIIPLNGKTVSGLHILENLQYLPAKENLSKSNKFDS